MVFGKVEIFALPIKQTYILLNSSYRRILCEKIIKNGVKKTFRDINYDIGYFYRLKNRKRLSLKTLFSLYNYFTLDIKDLDKNIIQIVSGKNNSVGVDNPKLPFDFDNQWGGILLGAVMGDGARTKLGGIIYNNKNEILVKSVINSVKKIFGDANYKKYIKKDGTVQIYFPKIVGDVIGMFGIERSYKIISDCYVDLSKFSIEFKKSFIRQFFDDEGNVRKSDRRLQIKQSRKVSQGKNIIRSNVERYAPKILLQIKSTLNEFEINSTISLETFRTKGNVKKGDFALNIYGKENLTKFNNLIGFRSEYKSKLLNDVISNYKFSKCGKNQRLAYALQNAMKVEKKYGYIDKLKLSKETEKSMRKTCTYYLVDLKKSKFIEVIKKPRTSKGYPFYWKYKLTKLGWSKIRKIQ